MKDKEPLLCDFLVGIDLSNTNPRLIKCHKIYKYNVRHKDVPIDKCIPIRVCEDCWNQDKKFQEKYEIIK